MGVAGLSRMVLRRSEAHIARTSGGVAHIIPVMEQSTKSLIALTLGCTFAATLFGFGSEVFSWRSAYEGLGREPLIQTTRLFVYVALGVLLAFRGGWPGVAAAVVMALVATSAEWALFPLSYGWAALGEEGAYSREFGDVARPPYTAWIAYDLFAVAISAALAQGLRMMAHVNPRGMGGG